MRDGNGQDRRYRRAVTRRASTIVPPESAFRRQDAVSSGQIWVEQFEGAAPIFSQSPMVSVTASPDGALGGKPVKASTEVPRSENIARAKSDLTILSC
jgi:hypothetical protein